MWTGVTTNISVHVINNGHEYITRDFQYNESPPPLIALYSAALFKEHFTLSYRFFLLQVSPITRKCVST